MAVDLSDYIENVKAEVNSPGTIAFEEATDAQWLILLSNSFWLAVLDGVITGYIEEDGEVIPRVPTDPDMGREFVQLVILYAAITAIRNKLTSLNTVFRTQAGPVSYETQQSATLLKAILDDLIARRKMVIERLGDSGPGTYTTVSDMIALRGSTTWIGQG